MKYKKTIWLAAPVLLAALLVAALQMRPREAAEYGAATETVAESAVAAEKRSAPALHTIVKETGVIITLPQYNEGDTLKITGAALEEDDWITLRKADKAYAFILEGETAEIPDLAFFSRKRRQATIW